MPNLPELYDSDIDRYFKDDPLYIPCMSVNDVPKRVYCKDSCFFIYNSAASNTKIPENKDGVHWLLYYNVKDKNNPDTLFFDSFGAQPDERLIKWSNKSGKKRIYSCIQIQSLKNSEACGWYCMYVSANLRAGRSYVDILLDFDPDTKKNEDILKQFFYSKRSI